MQHSSPICQTPSTPGRSSYYSARSHQPLTSSPLASPKSSPVVAAQARRQAQYKSRVTSSSGNCINQPSFLRERFKVRCLERAQKQRAEKIKTQRTASKSDVFFDSEMDYDEDESENSVMQDELFRRIIANAAHKKNHAYRLSYSCDIGSSFDPDMEDVSRWESELQDPPDNYVVTPEDLEQEELDVYAAEYVNSEELSYLDVAIDDFSAWSDLEDASLQSSEDHGMDMT